MSGGFGKVGGKAAPPPQRQKTVVADGRKENNPGQDLLDELRHTHQRQPKQHSSEEKGPEGRAEHRADATAETYPANDRRRDGGGLHAGPQRLCRSRETRHHDQRRDGCAKAGHRVGRDNSPASTNSGQTRGLEVASHGVEIPIASSAIGSKTASSANMMKKENGNHGKATRLENPSQPPTSK